MTVADLRHFHLAGCSTMLSSTLCVPGIHMGKTT